MRTQASTHTPLVKFDYVLVDDDDDNDYDDDSDAHSEDLNDDRNDIITVTITKEHTS